MKNKSNWEYNKKKQERRRIKKELKNSEKNTGSVEFAQNQMEKFINNQKLKEESKQKQKDEERSKELEKEESEQNLNEKERSKQLEKKESEQKQKDEKLCTKLEKKLKEQEILLGYDLLETRREIQNKEDMRIKLIQRINSHEEFEEKKEDNEQKEVIEGEIRELKRQLQKTSFKLLKTPKNLQNDYLIDSDSTKIILDANAIIDMLSNYDVTHRIQTISPPEALVVHVPDFIREEIKRKRIRKDWSYSHILFELNGIFDQQIKDTKFDLKIDNQKESIKKKYPDLSTADARCLLYAKHENAIVITADGPLKKACSIENVKWIDHFNHKEFSQTLNSNFENWTVGKIQRMKKYWSELKESNNTHDPQYLEKRNAFRAILHLLITHNVILMSFFRKIYFNSDSLPKKVEHFFDFLPENSNLTLEDIDEAIKKIPN